MKQTQWVDVITVDGAKAAAAAASLCWWNQDGTMKHVKGNIGLQKCGEELSPCFCLAYDGCIAY
jgi:hypothetical protein